jgi:Uma2 family endonuclease
VPRLWVIDPRNRTVHIYRVGEQTARLNTDTDTLELDDLVPGWRMSLAELWSLSG